MIIITCTECISNMHFLTAMGEGYDENAFFDVDQSDYWRQVQGNQGQNYQR